MSLIIVVLAHSNLEYYLSMNFEDGIKDVRNYYDEVEYALTNPIATHQQIKDFIDSYDEIIKKYLLLGAETATADNVVDLSFWIGNPTIEKGTTEGDYKTVDSWQCTNSGAIGRYLCFNYRNVGDVFLEVWGDIPSKIAFDYYQDIEGLPEGVYTIKAKAFAVQGKPNGNAVIYGVGQREKYTPIYNKYLADNGLDAIAEDDIMSDPTFMPYEVEGIFLAEGKTLRIGVKSIGVLSNSWTVIDNFELWFSGNSSSTTDYKDVLIDCIDEAYKLTEEEILFADRETLHVAIEEAMKSLEATTSEELKSATATLVVAIEEAKYAITLLNEFLNGVYKKVKEYSSDEDQIVQIMIAADENVESILDNPTTNKATLEDLKQKLTSLLNFATTFVVAKAEMEIEGLYNMEALFEFEDAFNGILDLMADGDLNNVEGALLALDEALITLRNSALNPDSDYTVWINNPNFEDEMKGWVNNGFDIKNESLDGKSSNTYCEKWVSGGNNIPDVSILQTSFVPNGIYEISVDASATQNGHDNVEGVSLVIYDGLGGEANYDRVSISGQYIKAPIIVPNPDYNPEFHPEEPETIIVEPAELTYKAVVSSFTGYIKFGVEAKNATCNHLIVDNFRLRYLDNLTTVHVIKAADDAFFVNVDGKKIQVNGVDDYKIYSINGQKIDPNAELYPGIYIIRASDKCVKVIVK